MTIPLILLVGKAGSGKDTVGDMLVELNGGTTVAFADKLKNIARTIFLFQDKQLWGPSADRNIEDPAYKKMKNPFLVRELGEHRVTEVDYPTEAWDRVLNSQFNIDAIGSCFKEPTRAVAKLKQTLKVLFDKHGNNLSPRKALQILGTEWGRAVERDVWVDYLKKVCIDLLGGQYKYNKFVANVVSNPEYNCPLVVVTDGRFLNEVIGFKTIGAQVWLVKDPQEHDAVGIANHQSESEIDKIPLSLFDRVIVNDKTLGKDHLRKQLEGAI